MKHVSEAGRVTHAFPAASKAGSMPLASNAVAACLALLLLGGFSGAAFAAWPHTPAGNLLVSTATGDQVGYTIASDGAGGAIISWQDQRSGNYDIYANHVLASGSVDPAWPANGRALCTAAGDQYESRVIADGTGGAIVTWYDRRTGIADIYAQHVLASGLVDGAWPVNGLALCVAAGDQYSPTIVSDGAGGAIVTWYDYRSGLADIYAQHVLASGVVDGAWPLDGQAICTSPDHQVAPTIVSDGAGGALITWYDRRSGNSDIYAQHVLATGVVDGAWPANGQAVCSAANEQYNPQVLTDGAGGAIVTWYDYRAGGWADIYAQHVLASGVVDGAWPANGRALCTAGNHQVGPTLVTDGAGGAIVAWSDLRSGFYDIYAQHVLASGVVDGAWPLDGRALCTATNHQSGPTLVADGAGGAMVTWQDQRSGAYDIYAHHVLASGVLDGAWPVDGRAVSTAAGDNFGPVIVSDGAGGTIVSWYDRRNGTDYDMYAQRIAASGHLGNPEIGLLNVRDVPNDNGGKVKLSWTSSYLDTEVPYVVDHYWIFRSAPPQVASQALARGARLLGRDAVFPAAGEAIYLATVENAATYYWEYVASQSATHFASGYSYTAATTNDSMAAGNPRTAFIVVAYDAAHTFYIASNADSGYSVDNLPPAQPGPFAASQAAGATHLQWAPSAAPDLDHYRLYRGDPDDFVPGPANQIASTTDLEFFDTGPPGSAYKLSAVDAHGNESDYAVIAGSGVTGVPGTLPLELSFGRPAPNPANQGVAIRLALPRATRATLAIHDVTGRQVRALLGAVLEAGVRDVTWDLRDASGARVADGIYFASLAAEGRTLTRRLTVVH